MQLQYSIEETSVKLIKNMAKIYFNILGDTEMDKCLLKCITVTNVMEKLNQVKFRNQ